jgi:hypothetical protein
MDYMCHRFSIAVRPSQKEVFMKSQVQTKAHKTSDAKLPASSLKKELRESLEVLKRDFEGLRTFVAEIASEGSLVLDRDLLTLTLEIQDAANDIWFETSRIKDKLARLG